MLNDIGNSLLLITFGMSAIMYNSSCKRLEASGNHVYSFNHVDPFNKPQLAKEVVDSSHMIKAIKKTKKEVDEPTEAPKEAKITKKHYAIVPEKLDSVDPDELPVYDPDLDTPIVKEAKIKISKRE